jgi:ketosteroid isomerase-like protein
MRKPMFATPQDAEAAFYEAIERGDLEEMMSIWAEDEEIVCIHPGGPRITGYTSVREAWRRVFEGGSRLVVRIGDVSTVQGPFTAVHSVVEHIGLADDDRAHAPVIATNVYVRSALGWRLLVHHASAAPPDSVNSAPKTLH